MPGSRSSQRPIGRADVGPARREHVEHEASARLEQVVRSCERADPLLVRAQVEVGPKRTGDETDALLDRRPAVVAEPQVDERLDPGAPRAPAADLEHPRRRVDADHRDPRLGGRNGDAAGADAELDDGAAGLGRLADVEGDVLRHLAAPVVVDLGDRVVDAQLHLSGGL